MDVALSNLRLLNFTSFTMSLVSRLVEIPVDPSGRDVVRNTGRMVSALSDGKHSLALQLDLQSDADRLCQYCLSFFDLSCRTQFAPTRTEENRSGVIGIGTCSL